jgi:predicted amidohydrolase YtcJ
VSTVGDAEKLVAAGVATGFGDAWLKLGGVKLFADGGMGARTIAIHAPPVQGEPENFGVLLWSDADLRKTHRLLAENGWQLITHAIGDRAIEQVLDSYAEAASHLKLEDRRWRIAHSGITPPAIQRRYREQAVIADGNPAFVHWIGSWFTKYGPERVRWSYPGKSYFENGVVLTAGTDVPVTPVSPWWGIWAAVARQEKLTGNVLAPEERLSIQETLKVYTRNGAYAGFEERDKGSIERDKLADFIVIDRNPLSIPTDQLKDVQVLETYVGGRRVYSAAKGIEP